MEFEKQHSLSVSLKQKLKIMCASCCNFCNDTEGDEVQKPLEQSEKQRCLSSWMKSELAHFFSSKQGRNRRCNSAEFKYDPLSYALNFEDDDSHFDEYPLRNFASRLPPSPVKQNNNIVVNVSAQKSNWS